MPTFKPLLSCLLLLWQLLPRLHLLRRQAIRQVFQRQLFFTGWQGLPSVLLAGGVVGLTLAVQLQTFLGGNSLATMKTLGTVLLRELGPLITGFVLVARSGSAIATELAAMRVNHEISTLENMGIPSRDYLLLPRVVAVVLSMVCLCLYLELTALLCGALVVQANGGHALAPVFAEILSATDLLWSLVKAAAFGLWIGGITCALGMDSSFGGFVRTAIPIAASRATLSAAMGLFVIDGLFALVAQAGAALG